MSGGGNFVAPTEAVDATTVNILLKVPDSEKKINKYKNGAIWQAKSMGWIDDDYPYLDDKE
jgi:hypothetical protein